MRLLYSSGVRLYVLAIHIASLFNEKASKWVRGRLGWKQKIEKTALPEKGVRRIWFHCASLGEFEQGRPVIEALRKSDEKVWIILTFFSPSGFEMRKSYDGADLVLYLPADTKSNARFFLNKLQPDVAIFVKYEFWFNFIYEISKRETRLYLISGIFRESQLFFKWYGRFFRESLRLYNHIFVQDTFSKELLNKYNLNTVSVSGDTRFDRVSDIASASKDIPELELFKGGSRLILIGSSWPGDEAIIARFINENPSFAKWVFAPHETGDSHLEELEKRLDGKVKRFSQLEPGDTDCNVVIIDSIGMLSSAYRYCDIAIIGGGFGKGIHNTLEAAVWGKPVLFGPNYLKFVEARGLISTGGAYSFKNREEFWNLLEKMTCDRKFLSKAGSAAAMYVSENKGATDTILNEIK